MQLSTKSDNPQKRNASRVKSVRANYSNDELQQSSLTLISTLHASKNARVWMEQRGSEHTCWVGFQRRRTTHSEAFMCSDCYLARSLSISQLDWNARLAPSPSCVCALPSSSMQVSNAKRDLQEIRHAAEIYLFVLGTFFYPLLIARASRLGKC